MRVWVSTSGMRRLSSSISSNGLSRLFIMPTCQRAPPWHSAEKSPMPSYIGASVARSYILWRFLKSDWPASRIPTEVKNTPSVPRTSFTSSRGDVPGRKSFLSPMPPLLHPVLRPERGDVRYVPCDLEHLVLRALLLERRDELVHVLLDEARRELAPDERGVAYDGKEQRREGLHPFDPEVARERAVHDAHRVRPVRPGGHQEHEQR